MSKLNSIKQMLQSVLAQFAKLSTDKGLLSFDGEELEVGVSVYAVDENGNESKPEDGEYKADDGTVYVIKDGKVEEIIEPEMEVPVEEPVEEAKVEDEEAAEEPVEAEDQPAEEPEQEQEPEEDPKDRRIADLEAEIARLEERIGALEAENEELKRKLEEPAAEPAQEQFENITKPETTGNKGLDRLNRILKA